MNSLFCQASNSTDNILINIDLSSLAASGYYRYKNDTIYTFNNIYRRLYSILMTKFILYIL